jgi:hypothetical protein
MKKVEKLLDESIATEGYIFRDPPGKYDDGRWVDLSDIGFDKLAEKFKTGHK